MKNRIKVDLYGLLKAPFNANDKFLEKALNERLAEIIQEKEITLDLLKAHDQSHNLTQKIEEDFEKRKNQIIVAYHILTNSEERKKYDAYYENILKKSIINRIDNSLNEIYSFLENINSNHVLMLNLSQTLNKFINSLDNLTFRDIITDNFNSEYESEILNFLALISIQNNDDFNEDKTEILGIDYIIQNIEKDLYYLFLYKKHQQKSNSNQNIEYIINFKDNCFKPYLKNRKKSEIKIDKTVLKLIEESFKRLEIELKVIYHIIESEELRNKIIIQINNSLEETIIKLNTIDQLSTQFFAIIDPDKFTMHKINLVVQKIEDEINSLYDELIDNGVYPNDAIAIIYRRKKLLFNKYIKEDNGNAIIKQK